MIFNEKKLDQGVVWFKAVHSILRICGERLDRFSLKNMNINRALPSGWMLKSDLLRFAVFLIPMLAIQQPCVTNVFTS